MEKFKKLYMLAAMITAGAVVIFDLLGLPSLIFLPLLEGLVLIGLLVISVDIARFLILIAKPTS